MTSCSCVPGQYVSARSRASQRHWIFSRCCLVTELGSQNGTYVDGELAGPHEPTLAQRVIRVGDTLLVPSADLRPFECAGVRSAGGFVRRPLSPAPTAHVLLVEQCLWLSHLLVSFEEIDEHVFEASDGWF